MASAAQPARFHFSTRDLLMMAALAALGGVTGTAVNAIGDALQAVFGFAGSMQWASGLHVLWLVLAVGLTRKAGAGTVTGLLKGAVEFLSGNTHGLLVLLVDLVAGLCVDLGMLPFRRRDSLPAYGLAGALASASNVLVFQLFAAAPEDVLRYVWALVALAALSGVVLAGVLGYGLLQSLRKSGVVRDQPAAPVRAPLYAAFLVAMAALAVGGGVILRRNLQGPPSVAITGDVAAPYTYAVAEGAFATVEAQLAMQGMARRYTGVPLREIIAQAQPGPATASAVVTASDGYSFFISRREIESNPDLLLAHSGEGDQVAYQIAGAENSKAWVRNVTEIRLVGQALLEVRGAVDRPFPYNPDDWQLEMDNAQLDLGQGVKKYQGSALQAVLERWEVQAGAKTLRFITRDGATAELPLAEAQGDADWRIWTVSDTPSMTLAIAHAGGRVLALDVVTLEVQ